MSNDPPKLRLAGDPMHWECMYNARTFIEEQLTKNPRIKCGGAGVGGCCADLDITIDGAPFNLLIRPKPFVA